MDNFKDIIEKISDGRILGALAGLIAFFWFLCKLPMEGSEPAKESAKA
jgi:hypothetical protein